MNTTTQITPMTTAGTHLIIERINRESGAYQWARETLLNAVEAKATEVEFGIEWEAVRAKGVYRRTVADNGEGMNPEQLAAFFNTFGGGGKPRGGVHENFGVGAKTSLLPWNRLGVVVISWQAGKPAMIWMMRDPATGEYGLRVIRTVTRGREVLDTVFAPFDDPETGIDWRKVKPALIREHGTVVVLLGNRLDQDTVLGDPYRAESDIKGVSAYLNARIWDMRETGARVWVTELRTQEKARWPKALVGNAHTRINYREVHGARYWIEYGEQPNGTLAHRGTVECPDPAASIDWYLWEGERPSVHAYAPETGFIGVLYKNELYDVTAHHATFRSFGVTERDVRANTWLVIRPPLVDPVRGGVYPRTDRNALMFRPPGRGNTPRPLPMPDWAAWFSRSDVFPQALLDALRKARGEQASTIEDYEIIRRLAERFGSRWRIDKLRPADRSKVLALFSQPGQVPSQGTKDPEPALPGGREAPVIESGRSGDHTVGDPDTRQDKASPRSMAGGLPMAIWRPGSEFEPGILGSWQAHDAEFPQGLIRLNEDHPVIQKQVEYWKNRYADQFAEDVSHELLNVYKEVAIAKVAHSEHLKSLIEAGRLEREVRSDAAITLALLGLIAEEALLQSRLDARFRVHRHRAAVGDR